MNIHEESLKTLTFEGHIKNIIKKLVDISPCHHNINNQMESNHHYHHHHPPHPHYIHPPHQHHHVSSLSNNSIENFSIDDDEKKSQSHSQSQSTDSTFNKHQHQQHPYHQPKNNSLNHVEMTQVNGNTDEKDTLCYHLENQASLSLVQLQNMDEIDDVDTLKEMNEMLLLKYESMKIEKEYTIAFLKDKLKNREYHIKYLEETLRELCLSYKNKILSSDADAEGGDRDNGTDIDVSSPILSRFQQNLNHAPSYANSSPRSDKYDTIALSPPKACQLCDDFLPSASSPSQVYTICKSCYLAQRRYQLNMSSTQIQQSTNELLSALNDFFKRSESEINV